MVLHAVTAASLGAEVDLVGLCGMELPPELEEAGVRVFRLNVVGSGLPASGGGWRALGRSALRIGRLAARSAAALRRLSRPDAILCASPPALPALWVAMGAARYHRARLVIDWHNLSGSLLALKLGARHPLVSALGWLERWLGRKADGHLCVSEAMAKNLRDRFGTVEPVVVYDRAAERFGRAGSTVAAGRRREENDDFTVRLVAPTGWTLDEEPTPLIDAVLRYDRAAAEAPTLRRLDVRITGEGPLRSAWEAKLRELRLRRVEVTTTWLSPDAYAELLASADLGVSLHRSSSGIDLAMKVADMLGSGIPVCAFDYGPCLREQIRPGEDGEFYRDGAELGSLLQRLLKGYPDPCSDLARLRQRAAGVVRPTWRQEWYPRVAVALGLASQRPQGPDG